MSDKRKIGYYWSRREVSTGYCHLRLNFVEGRLRDAAAEYNADPHSGLLQRMDAVRSVGKGCRYISTGCYEPRLVVKWQADTENWAGANRWYGLDIATGEICHESAKIITRLTKAGVTRHTPPEAVQGLLDQWGYECVTDVAIGCGSYWALADKTEDFKTCPWPGLEVQNATASAV